jgi:hypothetical protein
VPAPNSAVAVTDVDAWRAESPARAELAGRSFSEIKTVLANVMPDPIAARYVHLPPEERVLAVTSENNR